MRVVDTSAWIEWIADGPVGEKARSEFPEVDQLLVPTIVQLELAKWLAREAPDAIDEAIATTMDCLIVPLDTEIALQAAALSREQRLPIADSIIYATALSAQCELVTCEAHFEGLPNVIYVPKKAI